MADEPIDAVAAPAAPAPTTTETAQTAPNQGAVSTSEAQKESGTALSVDPAVEPVVTVAATWPDDWRARLAGEDKAFLKTLDRFTDPSALAKSYRALQTKQSSGELKSALPENATPEQVKAWRADNGIPDAPDGYKIELGEGHVIGEADKPLVDEFAKDVALAANMSNAQLSKVMSWYFAKQDAIKTQEWERDEQARLGAGDSLREEWGNEFKGNVNAVKNFLAGAPEQVRNELEHARMPDGTKLGSNPHVLNWFANLAREMNPTATLVPAGIPAAKGVADEISTIEQRMSKDRDGYFRDNAMQSRYRELVEARDKMKARAA